jgi:ligand-binding sensor domain-containing protein
MKKETIKRVVLSILPLTMIATIFYYLSLLATFHKGRHQYLAGTNPVLVTTDSRGQPWVLDNPNDGGNAKTLEGDRWVEGSYFGWASSMVFDHKGNMWIADGQHGLYKINGKNRDSFKTGNSGLASNVAYHLAVDKLDRLWITYDYGGGLSGSGVTLFDRNSWTTFTTNNSGLTTNEVTAIAFDSENRPWFGTTHGVSRSDGSQWINYSTSNSGLVGEGIWAIAFDKDGRAWIGTNGGINIFDGNAWTHYRFEEMGFGSPGSKIFLDHAGRIWVQGNYDVSIFDGSKWIGLAEEDGYDNFVFSITNDQQGNIWTANGNDRGVVEFDSEYPFASAWQTQPQRSFLSSGGMWYICLWQFFAIPLSLSLSLYWEELLSSQPGLFC